MFPEHRTSFSRSLLHCVWIAIILPVAIAQAALPSATTLAITSGATPASTVAFGSPLTLTATVLAAGVPVSPGQVQFCDTAASSCTGRALLGTVQLSTAGTASLTTFPMLFAHNFKAIFMETHSVAGSASAVTAFIVTGLLPTTTTLTASGSSGKYALTAKVAAASGPINLLANPPVTLFDVTSNQSLQTAGFHSSISGITFTPGAIPTLGASTDGVIADFNGDGKLDIASLSGAEFCGGPSYIPQLLIQLGNGDGTFTPQPVMTLGSACANIAVGDFNNDGKPDIVVANGSLLLGRGDGTFTTVSLPAITGTMAVGDFNHDGNADILSVDGTLLLGSGDGSFTVSTVPALASLTASSLHPLSIFTADFDGDGNFDLALSVEGSSTPNVYTLLILAGSGDGTFRTASNLTLPSPFFLNFSYKDIAAGDFNGDGKLDLVISGALLQGSSSTKAYLTLLGDGTGNFTALPAVAPVGNPGASNSSSIVTQDFDLDGKIDIAITTAESNLNVLFGNGDGTFTRSYSISQDSTSTPHVVSLLTGDFNGDGLPDLVAINPDAGVSPPNPYPDNSYVFLTSLPQTASASFTNVSIAGTGTHFVEATYPGIALFGPSTSNIVALVAQPVATTLTVSANPTSSAFGQQVAITALLSPSSVTGAGTSGESVSFQNGTSILGTAKLTDGVAVLAVTSLPAGTNSITALYAGDTAFAASNAAAVVQTVSMVAPTLALATSASPILVQNAVTVTATFTAAAGTPTGTATFTDINTTSSVTTVLATVRLTAGIVSLTTSSLAVGVHSISVQYNGDPTFSKVAAVIGETVENFSLGTGGSTTSPSITVAAAGGTATYSLSAAPVGGTVFPAAVSFTVTGLPPGATATFNPQVLAAGTASSIVTLAVNVPAQSSALGWPQPLGREIPTVIAIAGLLLLPLSHKRLRLLRTSRGWILAVLLSAASLFVAGCGGTSPAAPVTPTAPQSKTYTLVVAASSGPLSNTTNLILIVP